jgi:hypothetical protein
MKAKPDTPIDRTPIALLRAIKDGDIDPSSLSAAERRACVEHVHAEGANTPEIATLLAVSVRTIRRDIAQMREDHAATMDARFVPRMIGMLLQEAEIAQMRLRRLGRDKDSSPGDRIESAKAAWSVTRDLIQSLQSLGYLPSAVRQIQAELTHRVANDELQSQIREVEAIATSIDLPNGTQLLAQIHSVQSRLPPNPASPAAPVAGSSDASAAGAKP